LPPTLAEYVGTLDLYDTITYEYVNTPSPPSKPDGETSGYVGVSYSYSTSTIDPNGDSLRYQFYWGDGSYTTTGWYTSSATASASHSWGSTGYKYVKVRAQDSTGAWSDWSSSLTVYISGGGGGGCPYVYAWNGEHYVMDNNLLPASEISNGADVEDYYRLEQLLLPTHQGTVRSVYSLQIREFEHEHDYFDQVKLLAVDYDSDVNVVVTPDG